MFFGKLVNGKLQVGVTQVLAWVPQMTVQKISNPKNHQLGIFKLKKVV